MGMASKSVWFGVQITILEEILPESAACLHRLSEVNISVPLFTKINNAHDLFHHQSHRNLRQGHFLAETRRRRHPVQAVKIWLAGIYIHYSVATATSFLLKSI